MIPKIKPDKLDNKFFIIKGTNNNISSLYYLDTTITNSSLVLKPSTTISMDVNTKTFKIDNRIELNISKTFNNFNFNDIKDIINKDFINKITKLGKQNRNDYKDINLDISVKEYKFDISRKIRSKFNSASNIIGSIGRLGPAQYTISNSKTYDYILSYINKDDILVFDNAILNIGGMPYLIDNSIEDDIILFGRKNEIDRTGVHCLILTDDDNNIRFDKIDSPYSPYSKLIMYYKLIEIGNEIQTQYLSINTRDITHFRYKKLQRIKELYG